MQKRKITLMPKSFQLRKGLHRYARSDNRGSIRDHDEAVPPASNFIAAETSKRKATQSVNDMLIKTPSNAPGQPVLPSHPLVQAIFLCSSWPCKPHNTQTVPLLCFIASPWAGLQNLSYPTKTTSCAYFHFHESHGSHEYELPQPSWAS